MSESSLTLDYNALRSRIGDWLGYSPTSSNWDTTQTTRINNALNDGLRRFYSGEVDGRVHQWSFLYPGTILTLHTVAAWEASTAYSVGDYVIPTTYNRRSYYCSTAGTSSSSEPTWTTTEEGTLTDGTVTWTVKNQYFDAPDDFGALACKEMIIMNTNGNYGPVVQRPESMVIYQLEKSTGSTGWPRMFAVRPKEKAASKSSRFEFVFWPLPDSAYSLFYTYQIIPNTLSAANPYLYGSGLHSDTILACCLAEAEKINKDNGENAMQVDSMRLMRKSILSDLNNKPSILGNLNMPESNYGQRIRAEGVSYGTYNDTLYQA